VSAKIFRNLERPLLVARFGCSATLNRLWITARVFAQFRPDRDGPILAHSFLLYGCAASWIRARPPAQEGLCAKKREAANHPTVPGGDAPGA
jgi:hypothetical protein